MTVPSVEAGTKKYLFGMCDCVVSNDVGTGDFSLLLAVLHVCGYAYMRLHVSPAINCCMFRTFYIFKVHHCIVLVHEWCSVK